MSDSKIKARLVSASEREYWREHRNRPSYRREKAVLFVFPQSENGVENFIYRATRPVKLYRSLLPEIYKKLGIPADTKARWSDKAGCSCPCSPGFILNHENYYNYEAVVTADDPDAVKHDGTYVPARVEAIERVMAGGV